MSTGKSRMIYMKTTRDRFELPEAVANSGQELAEMVGITADSLYCAISKGVGGYHKIMIEEDDS